MTEQTMLQYLINNKQQIFDDAVVYADKELLENPCLMRYVHHINNNVYVECERGFDVSGWAGDIFYNGVSIHQDCKSD